MINEIRDVDFGCINKLSIKRCLELNIIPLIRENKLIIVCDLPLEEKIKEFLNLIFDENFEIEKIDSLKLERLKKIIILESYSENIEIKIIEEAINLRASDIHFEPERNGVYIRFRIDGLLGIKYKISLETYEKLLSRIKNESNLDITERRKPQDGKINFKFKNKEYNLRISIIKTIYGEKIVLRILKKSIIKLSLQDLACDEKEEKKLINIVKKRDGLVIVNGPTGSGKSTSLYSIIEKVKDLGINVTTIEDPVEVSIDGITQIQLNRDINLDFSNALKSVLRQDPDIIMIGEIRDSETAKIAVRSSMTGHKVYSTVHSISPREVFFRLHDLGIEERILKESLVGIISQRLLRKLCSSCKEEDEIDFIDKKIIGYKPIGCEKCNYTGYKGRILLSQITKIDREITLQKLYENKELLNNKKLLQLGINYFEKGLISYLDYRDFVSEQEE